jgi:prepilin-type N-terminal cleavage/methylation domain-containing protein
MKNKRGFTLFELLVSISIIAILTALATVSYGIAQRKARDARRTQDMDAMRKANELYYAQNNYMYAASEGDLIAGGFLEKLPTDPKNSGDYIYSTSWNVDTYCFCAAIENEGSGNSGDNCNFAEAEKNYYCVRNQQ